MVIRFDALWKQLANREISVTEFRRRCNVSDDEFRRIKSSDPQITLKLINKLCAGLECNIGDILTYH